MTLNGVTPSAHMKTNSQVNEETITKTEERKPTKNKQKKNAVMLASRLLDMRHKYPLFTSRLIVSRVIIWCSATNRDIGMKRKPEFGSIVSCSSFDLKPFSVFSVQKTQQTHTASSSWLCSSLQGELYIHSALLISIEHCSSVCFLAASLFHTTSFPAGIYSFKYGWGLCK